MKNYTAIPKHLWDQPRFIALSPLSKFAVICGIVAQSKQKKNPVTLDIMARYLDLPSITLTSIVDELVQQQFMKAQPDWGYIFDFNL